MRADTDRLYDQIDETLRDVAHISLLYFVWTKRRNVRKSWEQIAYDVRSTTDIAVSGEWLRTRFSGIENYTTPTAWKDDQI